MVSLLIPKGFYAVFRAAHDIIFGDLFRFPAASGTGAVCQSDMAVPPVIVRTVRVPDSARASKSASVLTMMPRLLTRIAFLPAIVCALATITIAQKRGDDVVRVNTELVQSDFMVFDKQGNFVDGLKADQFMLKVEGKPRDITFFDRIAAGSRNEEAQLAAARGNPKSENAKGGVVPMDRGRTIMFYLDDLHLSPGSLHQVRMMLKRFIDREMRQNDRAAIVAASGQLGFLQQLTDNRDVMMSAVDRLRNQQLTLHTSESPPMTEYQAIQIEQHNPDVLDFFVDALIKENPMLQRAQAAEMVGARAGAILDESSSITTRSLGTFKSLVDGTTALASRKLIFFISDGFYLERNHSDNYDRLQLITSAAARSGTVIYSIDARGLSAGLPDASVMVPADPSGRLSRGGMGDLKAAQDGMNALASDTGGRAFFNSNSLSTAVGTALKETSVYYLLAWRPETDEQRNPKFRRIEVSIKGHPDLVVRFRRGFGESVSDEAKRNKEAANLPVRKTPTEEINAALRAVYPLTSVPVSISLAYLDTAQYGGTLTTSIKIETNNLTFERQGEVPTAVVDLAGLVLNDQGKSVSTFSKRITVKAGTTGGTVQLPNNFFYNHFALIKPGIYQVRVAAVDIKQGTRGSAHQWITIPNLQAKELSMSSLIVGEKKADPEAEAANPNSTEPQAPLPLRQVSINVDHIFARSSNLRFLTFIYNAATSPAAAPQLPVQPAGGNAAAQSKAGSPDLAVQVQVFRDNEPVITTALHKIQTEGLTDVGRVPYAADVMLNDLQPGAYVLQVTVIDRLSKSSASQKINFQIE
jgi:VWFA-related protein